MNERVTTLVRGVVQEPVKEAVRDALAEEERRRDESATVESGTDEGSQSSRLRRLLPVLGVLVVLSFVVRRWRPSSADERSEVGVRDEPSE